MKLRMAIATSVLVVGAFTLSACGQKNAPVTNPAATATSATTEPAATTPATMSAATDLVGDWQDTKAKWAVHFKDDGTYAEDYEGITDFRVGKFAVEAGNVSLIGDDGITDKGKIDGQSLVFKLGTLTRK